jgi:tripartite-type tricarboxylate transporter receptor subunit TctC
MPCSTLRLASLALLVALSAIVPAAAQQDFYRGKTITMVMSAGPGGGYLAYAATMAKHMRKYIPGNPDIIRQHRQGAGGLVAANYLHTVAPRDGLTFASIHREAVSGAALLEDHNVDFDPRSFSWIGSITRETSLCVSWHTNPVKTLADAKARPLIVGGLGPGGDTDIMARIFNNLLGTKFKLVTGYKEGTAITLAIERGEVEGRCGWSLSSIKTTKYDWLTGGKLNILFITSVTRPHDKELPPNVPLVTDVVDNPVHRQVLELILLPQEMARPILAPPGIPADRLAILRNAFNMAMEDPEFIAEAKELKLDRDWLTGPQVEDVVKRIMATPKEIVALAKETISNADKTEVISKK